MREKIEIAFRRQVRRKWLDQGLALSAQHVPWSEARIILADRVGAENPGKETIRKVLEHIRRIWFEPPADAVSLQHHAVDLFRLDSSPENRLILNWGMAVAAYPFIGSVAEALGRQFKLHQRAERSTVQSRLREQYGDRDFVNRITRYNVSSFLEWGIIAESKPRGTYVANGQTIVRSPSVFSWLTEAIMISRGLTQVSFSTIVHHPILFPFASEIFNASTLQKNPSLTVVREGLHEEYVVLNLNSGEATPVIKSLALF
jgi:hypothetical protein